MSYCDFQTKPAVSVGLWLRLGHYLASLSGLDDHMADSKVEVLGKFFNFLYSIHFV